ncbi:TPA: septum formation initiator family protein [Candidatus Spyradomonas excrementavium]|nr:septum formation initiator family protein [Candidatus Spyradomonas excrementavium]
MAGLIEKTQEKNNKRKNKIRFYYSFLTIVLLVCLAQIGISAFNNITKSISYHGKINKMKELNKQAYAENQRLKEELEDFSSMKSLEAIARNNLKMAGEDEVLVIINKPQQQAPSDTKNKKKPKKK